MNFIFHSQELRNNRWIKLNNGLKVAAMSSFFFFFHFYQGFCEDIFPIVRLLTVFAHLRLSVHSVQYGLNIFLLRIWEEKKLCLKTEKLLDKLPSWHHVVSWFTKKKCFLSLPIIKGSEDNSTTMLNNSNTLKAQTQNWRFDMKSNHMLTRTTCGLW